jgi:hypothetical protein
MSGKTILRHAQDDGVTETPREHNDKLAERQAELVEARFIQLPIIYCEKRGIPRASE